MTEQIRRVKAEAKRPRLWLTLAAFLVLMAGGAWAAVVSTAPSHASVQGGSTLAWDGKKGADACARGTTGNMLWIFNPHSNAVPKTLTVTWSTGETDTYAGWTRSGQSQDWHLTVNIVGAFPPKSASVSYDGTLGKNPILTISGCNESTTGTTTTGTTTTGGTTTSGTTTTNSTTTVTTTGTTTVTTPGTTTTVPGRTTTVTNTVTSPTQTVTAPTQTVTVTTPGNTTTVTHTVTVTTPGKTKVIIKKKVVVHVKKVKVPAKPKHRHTVPAPPVQGYTR
jgi:hypothetical protein